MHWFTQAPANIALIKYMGKKSGNTNLPDNASLSYTLDNLVTTVQLEQRSTKNDLWEPLTIPGGKDFNLSAAGQKRFIEHLARLKNHFGYSGGFLIQSTNNFPQGSGLASSASSFAALTKCACLALSELTQQPMPGIEEQAQLSRQGSGSSCRSFYSPWALWKEDDVIAVDLPYKKLIHQVVVISGEEKAVSSSEAHQRVKSSPFYAGRSQRAEDNLRRLLSAFESEDWLNIKQICWNEFHDMHHLFSTSEQPFSYISNESQNVLNHLDELWSKQNDGPVVTMDAGPNIHLLYRQDQRELAHQFKADHLVGNYDVL